MYKPQRGICSGTLKHEGCGDEGIIMTNSRKLCQKCESNRKPKKAIRQVSVKKRDKIDSGESEWPFFLALWATRPHRCTVCKEPLGDEPKPSFFSHILAKGPYPAFRLLDINVVIKCEVCHHEYGTIAPSILLEEDYPKWYRIFEMKEYLIEKYYGKDRFED